MTTTALIVAAGRGIRAGGPLPKQWQSLAGRRVIDWTLRAFEEHPGIDRVLLVINPEDAAHVPPGREWVGGGSSRAASVRNGLEALAGSGTDLVLIHDAARATVPRHVIDGVLNALKTAPAAAPGLAVTDALWTGETDKITGTRDRTGLWRAQTPQGFSFARILEAHRSANLDAMDDVQIARAAGLDVTLTRGDEANLKITTPGDFARAAHLLRGPMDIRTGTGFDVHRFGEGSYVTLCGVELPHSRGLQGHSDADVGMHALTDALYGALAEGDIGQHFPPSDPQWKGAQSDIFLRHAAQLVRQRGFRITNVDVTLICERPKIGPHAPAMRSALAEILDLERDRVSVKATTSERLGFTGREEGIAAMASATLLSSSDPE